ncbi:uncharacterized protein PHACADRAFT_210693 [Phanerochaete carnosa HHB-10118-sp]|uniref:F-box domain-containing protein n=1 Tax=Phanerochaete carnosa (strain HHB-10118-sp) TaxID=650164 RepID=K5VNA7_PHACS|nr:uncharacterized protein PHACADRAFT_210693 [Phanerochaete carnosa HHB-10118-sp]EKM52928.1 hypothetical protein PHACADRAFT_210693 [Phanerochaete carnosa HHB-10118-sp]
MPPSKATEIPEELFEHILWHAGDCGGEFPLQWVAKAHVSACASVCRCWARQARRELFCYVTLRTLNDVNHFRNMLSAPALPGLEPIAEIVVTLNAAPDNRDVPWLHLVFLFILPTLGNDIVLIVNTLPSEKRPWRTLHPSLPRSLPGSTMPLHELNIMGVHFPSGRALARLLSSLPHLALLNAANVTFDTQLSSENLFTPPFGLELCSIMSNDHALCLAFLPRLLANLALSGPPARICAGRIAKYVLEDEDSAHIRELFELLDTASNIEVEHRYGVPFAGAPAMNILVLRAYGKESVEEYTRRVAPDIMMYFKSSLESRALSLVDTAGVLVLSTPLHVHGLHVDLTVSTADSAHDFCTESLWTRFSEIALKFARIQHVEVLRSWNMYGNDTSETLGITDAAFKSLIEARKFRCRYLDHGGQTVRLEAKIAVPKNASNNGIGAV